MCVCVCVKHYITFMNMNPEELDYLDQVCLIRARAKLCRAETNDLNKFSLI